MPFTIDDFFSVFVAYNNAIWPAHIAAYAAGIGVLAAVLTGRSWSASAVFVMLGAFWIWNGIAYHFAFFAPINPVARIFAVLFVVQGVLFLALAWRRPPPVSLHPGTIKGAVSLALVVYALAIYPLLGMLAGHGWPRAPVFGVAPCPTTIFTLALLLASRTPLVVAAIPVLWALVGTTAAVLLGVPEDLGLLVAVAAFLLLREWGKPAPVAA